MKFKQYITEAIQWGRDKNTGFDKIEIKKDGLVIAKIFYSFDFPTWDDYEKFQKGKQPKDGMLNIEWAETLGGFKGKGYASMLLKVLKKRYPKYKIRGKTQKSNVAAIKLVKKFGGKIDY